MPTRRIAKALAGTRWTLASTAKLSFTSPDKLGSFSINGSMPADDALLDLEVLSMSLRLQVGKLDTGHFLMNAPMRGLATKYMGANANWQATSDDITITSAHSFTADGVVVLGDNSLKFPAEATLELISDDELHVAFTARYVFPHVKLPVPGLPEQNNLPLDLAGTLVLGPAE